MYILNVIHFKESKIIRIKRFFSHTFMPLSLFDSISENDNMFTLLLNNGANIEQETIIGSTALDLATFDGNEKYTKILIDAGANVNHSGLFEDVPLHKTAEFGGIRFQTFEKINSIKSNEIINFNEIIRFWRSHFNAD